VFLADLNQFCRLVAENPGLGRINHGYGSTLHGVVHGPNWIFFLFDESEVRFVHMIGGRREKSSAGF
jgi:hypothetical protein